MLAAQLISFLFSKSQEDPARKVDGFLQALRLCDDQLKDITALFQTEMEKGLSGKSRAAAAVKMLPTHVRSAPNGSESGQFLALDLGESYCKVQQIKLGDGDLKSRKVEIQEKMIPIQRELNGRAEELFDFLSRSLKQFMNERDICPESRHHLALTFAFPCEQMALNQGRLLNWTKNIRTGGLQGKDVVHALKESIKKTGGMDIDVLALMNDSVATLMTSRFDDEECEVGLIIGAGTNACYMEELRHVDSVEGDEGQMCVNTEWGAFGDDGGLDHYITEFDREVDAASSNPGKQIFEKMVSSMYLGELVRLAVLKMAKQGLLFQGFVPNALKAKGRITLAQIIAIDDHQRGLQNTRVILEALDVAPTEEDCIAVQRVSSVVSHRSSALVAACLAAVLMRIKQRRSMQISVAVDGELYKKLPQYPARLQRAVQRLAPGCSVRFTTSPCGTGTGAALVTVAAKQLTWRQQQVDEIVHQFKLSEEQLILVKSRMRVWLEAGLSQQEPETKMLLSYVHHLPNGTESGQYLILELEETHFRAALVNLRNGLKHHTNVHHKIYELPLGLTRGHGEKYFDHVARCISDFLDYVGLKNTRLPAALTVSFPCEQTAIDKGTLLGWSQCAEGSDCEGQDIVTLLREARDRHATFDLDLVAVVNDTVGTMVDSASDDPRCEVGLIVGSGVNICYMEELKNIKYAAVTGEAIENNEVRVTCAEGGTGEHRMCINTECGRFGNNSSLDDIIAPYDVQVDLDSPQPGKQRFEKLTGGWYLGEVIRLVLLDLSRRQLLYKGHERSALKTPGSFHIDRLYQIESGRIGALGLRSILQNLGLGGTCEDSLIVKQVCGAVSRRAAQLCGAAVAAVIDKVRENRRLERLDISVAVDGELYTQHPQIFKETTSSLAPRCTVTFVTSGRGSGTGAALVAAAAAATRHSQGPM